MVNGGLPTAEEIDAIARIPDPTLRNYHITKCYHDLSSAMATRLAGAANWCTFAAWASKQAGRSIRGEDLDAAIDAALDDLSRSGALAAVVAAVRVAGGTGEAREIQRVVRSALGVDAVLKRTSAAVARGNVKVFEEIAPVFAGWCRERMQDAEYDTDSVEAFVARLRSGEPPDGQDHLRTAIRSYQEALFIADPTKRAQAILFGTLSVGFHEQTRLQPEIAAALGSAIEEPDVIVSRIEAAFFPAPGLFAKLRRFTRRLFGRTTPLERAVRGLVEAARARLRPIITEHMMTIELAGTRLELGTDLRQSFPPSLRTIGHERLATLLSRVDPTPDSVTQSGAKDWADFADRMHFITDLFRAYQEVPGLLGAPLRPAELEAIRAGRRP